MNCRRRALLVAVFALFAVAARAQWSPTGALANVLVVNDCNETAGDAMVSRLEPPTIYLCPRVVSIVRRSYPGAEIFFLAHEYGHIALQTSDESFADCWAAQALARAPNGRRSLAAVMALLGHRPEEESPRYGTPSRRVTHIRECAAQALQAAEP